MMKDEDDWLWSVVGLGMLFFAIWLLLHIIPIFIDQPCMTDMECELKHGPEETTQTR